MEEKDEDLGYHQILIYIICVCCGIVLVIFAFFAYLHWCHKKLRTSKRENNIVKAHSINNDLHNVELVGKDAIDQELL